MISQGFCLWNKFVIIWQRHRKPPTFCQPAFNPFSASLFEGGGRRSDRKELLRLELLHLIDDDGNRAVPVFHNGKAVFRRLPVRAAG